MQLLFLILSMAAVMITLFGIYMFVRLLIAVAIGMSIGWGAILYHISLSAVFMTLGVWALFLYWPQSLFN